MKRLALSCDWYPALAAACLLALPINASGSDALKDSLRFRLDREAHLRQFDPVFQRPISHGKDAVPVGNGDLAAVAWQPEHLTWMLNKCDIGGASQVARLRIETPDPITEKVGRLQTRLSLADATATVDYEAGKLPESAGWDWRGTGRAAPKPGDRDLGSMQTRFYVAEGRNVFLLSYKAESPTPHPVTLVFERWLQKEYGGTLHATVQGNTLAIHYSEIKGGHAESYAAVLAFDGFADATLQQRSPVSTALQIPAATNIEGRIAIAVVTSLEADNPLQEATKLAVQTLGLGEARVREPHDRFWVEFWDRSFVDSGHPYLTALYHMSLYELGITSRGARPVKFNGALNLFSEKFRSWGAGYWCHNQSEVYLQCYAANHVDLVDGFHDWIAKVRPEAVKAARKSFQVQGAYYPEVMSYDFSVKDPDTPQKVSGMGWILSSGVRYALMMRNRYQYTLDETFLREKAYPVIRDCADFYVNYGQPGADGLYHVSPSMSWEEGPVGKDAHADCAAWRAIFPLAIKAAKRLGVDTAKIPVWQDRLSKAPPYPIEDDLFSVVMRDDGTAEPTDHFQWQVPNLSSVFPYGAIGIGSDADLKKTAEATFDRYRYNADAGHEFLPVIAARLGNADWWRSAMFNYVQYFQVHDQGLLNYYNITGSKLLSHADGDIAHPYLEGSGVLATAVNEMLLQSHEGIIRVFPAVPERWPARFILRAAGSFMVASEHRGRDGIPYVVVQPVGGDPRRCRVATPWLGGTDLTVDGRRVKLDRHAGVAEFDTVPGRVYVLTPAGKAIEDVPMVDVAFDRQYAPCRFGNVWFGNRDSQMNHTSWFPLW